MYLSIVVLMVLFLAACTRGPILIGTEERKEGMSLSSRVDHLPDGAKSKLPEIIVSDKIVIPTPRPVPADVPVVVFEPIYFAFDQFNLTRYAEDRISEYAAYLALNPDTVASIRGNCDVRGTESYNLVLGEKRANAVRNFLRELGVGLDRLSVVSYGESRPVCSQSTVDCHAKNRRVDVVITKGAS